MKPLKLLKSKKGATRTTLVVGYVILMVVIAVFFYFLYARLAAASVVASASTTSLDVGTLIEASYSAPGDVKITYETPQNPDTGLPAIGSLLVNGEESKIITHPRSEDAMYYEIANNALTAWGVGIAMQAANKVNSKLKARAQRKARGQAGAWYYEANEIKYNDVLNAHLGDSRYAYYKTIDGKGGTALKNVVGDEMSIGLLGQLGKDKEMMAIIEHNPKAARKLAEIAETTIPAHQTWMIERNADLFGDAGIKTLKSKKGQAYLKSLGDDPNVLDYFYTAPVSKADDFADFKKVVGTAMADDSIRAQFAIIAHESEASELARKLKTSEGDDVLAMFGRKGSRKTRTAYLTRKKIPNDDLRAVFTTPARADSFTEFYKGADGDNFRTFVSKSGRRNYVKLTDAVADSSKITDPAKRLADLQKNKKVTKSLRAAGIKTKDAQKATLKSMMRVSDAEPALIKSLGSRGADASEMRRFLSSSKHKSAVTGVLDVTTQNLKAADKIGDASKLKKAVKFAKGADKYNDARQAYGASKWIKGTRMTRGGRRFVAALGRIGWMKTAGSKTSQGMEWLGKYVSNSFIGKGFKGGLAGGGIIAPLDACEKTGGIRAVVCGVIARVVFIGLIALDIAFITYPMLMMIITGHRTSRAMKGDGVETMYVGDGMVIFADPPNCDSEINNLDWPKSIGEGYVDWYDDTKAMFDKDGAGWFKLIYEIPLDILAIFGPLFGELAHAFPGYERTQNQLDTPSVRHHLETDGECLDSGGSSPNVYISQPEFPGWGVLGAFVPAIMLDGITACGFIGMASTKGGIICYLSAYSIMAGTMMAFPQYMVPWFTGSNIYPSDEWWYANSPVEIEITNEFDSTTGLQEVSIYAAAQ